MFEKWKLVIAHEKLDTEVTRDISMKPQTKQEHINLFYQFPKNGKRRPLS
jgi:hypothetical protein